MTPLYWSRKEQRERPAPPFRIPHLSLITILSTTLDVRIFLIVITPDTIPVITLVSSIPRLCISHEAICAC